VLPDAEFVKRFLALAEVMGETLSDVRIAGYWSALDDLTPNDLYAALNDALRTCTFFPKPAEIRHRAIAAADVRRMRAVHEFEALRADTAPAALPALPEPAPVESDEERIAREARVDAGWNAFLDKWREFAKGTIHLDTEQAARTREQIDAWRAEQQEHA
jgi:hypothetical protein